MNESSLTAALRKAMPPSIHWIKHTDSMRCGIPDVSISARGATSWWEIKYANPRIITREVQKLEILRLSYHARVRYIIFDAMENNVQIVEPRLVDTRKTRWETVVCLGFDFAAVAQQMLRIHYHD